MLYELTTCQCQHSETVPIVMIDSNKQTKTKSKKQNKQILQLADIKQWLCMSCYNPIVCIYYVYTLFT